MVILRCVRKISSNAGEILDASIDRYAELLFCLGLCSLLSSISLDDGSDLGRQELVLLW